MIEWATDKPRNIEIARCIWDASGTPQSFDDWVGHAYRASAQDGPIPDVEFTVVDVVAHVCMRLRVEDIALSQVYTIGADLAGRIGLPVLFRDLVGQPGNVWATFVIADWLPHEGTIGDDAFKQHSRRHGIACIPLPALRSLGAAVPSFLLDAGCIVTSMLADLGLERRDHFHVSATLRADGVHSHQTYAHPFSGRPEDVDPSAHERARLACSLVALERAADRHLGGSGGYAPFAGYQLHIPANCYGETGTLVGFVASPALCFRAPRDVEGFPPQLVSFGVANRTVCARLDLLERVGEALAASQPDGPMWDVVAFEDDVLNDVMNFGPLKRPGNKAGDLPMLVAGADAATALRRTLLFIAARKAIFPDGLPLKLERAVRVYADGRRALAPKEEARVHEDVQRELAPLVDPEGGKATDPDAVCRLFLDALPPRAPVGA